MSQLRPLDPAFPIERQLTLDAGPVVLINLFTLDKADEKALVAAWKDDAEFMKRQPGFISTQLHRAVGESPAYLNYAVWERSLTSVLHLITLSSGRSSPSIRRRSWLPRTCSKRLRCQVSASPRPLKLS